MKKDIHFSSRMLTLAGGLMTISGILMAVCTKLSIGGVLWAAAACMFFAAYHFRIRENKEKRRLMMNKLPDKLTVKRSCNVNNVSQIAPFDGKQTEGSISFHVLRNEE